MAKLAETRVRQETSVVIISQREKISRQATMIEQLHKRVCWLSVYAQSGLILCQLSEIGEQGDYVTSLEKSNADLEEKIGQLEDKIAEILQNLEVPL